MGTMAIPADIYPSAVRGTGAGISAAMGKVGATIGSYLFSLLASRGMIPAIFWCITATSVAATLLTMFAIPFYNGEALDIADKLARHGESQEAVKTLFKGPQTSVQRNNSKGYRSNEVDSVDEAQV